VQSLKKEGLFLVAQRPTGKAMASLREFSLTLIPFICSLVEGEPKALEHSAMQWISPDDILFYNFPAADLPVLEEYLALRRSRS
jgi:8-oxo-dGTP diphosphatase